ncbi:small multidrug resistance protein [Nitzschia inconspicua]|uniref:Small multidrug resistance protein n=1 Tax=Nitzschia inconspicua TaxID=303405 RepID=A0A9K3LNL9_9STRA|nr:small multidrug resistance protein [Nitzschia inconspicua]
MKHPLLLMILILLWTITLSSLSVSARHYPTDFSNHHQNRPTLINATTDTTKRNNPSATTSAFHQRRLQQQQQPNIDGGVTSPFSSFVPTTVDSIRKSSQQPKQISTFIHLCQQSHKNNNPVSSTTTTTTFQIQQQQQQQQQQKQQHQQSSILFKETPKRIAVVLLHQLRGGSCCDAAQDTSVIVRRSNNVLISLILTLQSRILELNRFIGDDPNKCWMVLFAAIALDTISTVTMKKAQQKQSLALLLSAYTGYFLSLSSLAMAIQAIDIGVAYAPWERLSYRPSGSSGLVNEMMQPKYYVYP